MIYAFVNSKGGVGKTTTAVHHTVKLAQAAPTLLIDADAQGSAASWAAWRREANREPMPTTARLYGKEITNDGRVLSKNFAHTVIDAGGRDSASLRGALLLADMAIIPVGASTLDSAALSDMKEIIDLSKQYNHGLIVKVLLTRIHPNPQVRETAEMASYLVENGFEVLDTHIHERLSFRRAVADGLTVEELDSADSAAAQEINAFFDEVTK